MVQQLSTNTFTTAKWIVSPTASDGTHTTIASALTSASSGDTIFIRPGTYTENPTLKAGVNLTAFGSDSSLNQTGIVIINGNCTLSTAGSVTIQGIQLQTNSANCLTVSGSVASIVNLNNCCINATNNTAISYSSSSASSVINLNQCTGNLGTTGITLFSSSGAGTLRFYGCRFTNTGASTTSTTFSAGMLNISYSYFESAITTSGTSTIQTQWNGYNLSAINTTCLTCGGSGANFSLQDQYSSGSASAISVGSTLTISTSSVASTNTNAITGAGSITFTNIAYTNSSQLMNTTTQSGGVGAGIRSGTAPAAGYIGEQIRSFNSSGQASSGNNVAFNITSINVTAGIWDISGVTLANFTGISTRWDMAVTSTSATIPGTGGDNSTSNLYASATAINYTACVPSYRVTLSATTTYFLVGFPLFSTGACTGFGRISATRVG